MPPITIRIPTQQELLQMSQDPNSLLAQYNARNTPAPAVGSGAAVTAAGAPRFGTASQPSNLNSLSNPDWIKAMSEMISQINIDAQQKANAARIPGATGLEQKSSANIGSALAGEIPNDVYREMAQRSAERGVSTGSPMGANSTADIMRALGLTSLDLQNTGQGWLNAALARNPGATPANTQALVTTPAQAEALALQRQNMELDYLARMAAIQAASRRTGAGYGGGTGGGGGGGFRPATNWQTGGQQFGQAPITQPWHDPGIGSYGTMAGSGWTPGTYTDPMNPLYGYTQTPGLPNSVPGGTPWQPPEVPAWDDLLPPMSPAYDAQSPFYYDDQMFDEDLANFYPEYGG